MEKMQNNKVVKEVEVQVARLQRQLNLLKSKKNNTQADIQLMRIIRKKIKFNVQQLFNHKESLQKCKSLFNSWKPYKYGDQILEGQILVLEGRCAFMIDGNIYGYFYTAYQLYDFYNNYVGDKKVTKKVV